ncbi:MAG: putative selenium-dependent hydroxylase accessory protein YqeC [Firmicutes bacterium]|jgi:molybdenum cofactor cytidylyltransferase|nr:putative selenium-dependent hydroxylase accessory protein YqeC [Bacillota bacterium]
MDPLSLVDSLQLGEREIVAVYGAGGKTSLLYRLSRELSGLKKKVILTTTTKIYKPGKIPCVICSELREALVELRRELLTNDLVALGSSLLPDNKLTGIDPSWVEEIYSCGAASYILVEADGAAGKPVKGYAPYEPVLPSVSTLIISLLGLDALGLFPDSRFVHRPELLLKITGSAPGERLTGEHLLRYLKYMIELGSDMSPAARIIPVVNKVDLFRDKEMPEIIIESALTGTLFGEPALDRILFTSLKEEAAVKYIFDLTGRFSRPFITCVVLAAGSSCRMGANKLSLKINDQTLLDLSLKNVLKSQVDEVVLVIRPGFSFSQHTLEILNDPRIKVVINNNHLEGIASSLKTGIAASHPLAQGILFTLADQPFIPPEVYNLLIKEYTSRLNLLTFPSYKGKRGNPVLFDRRTWGQLMGLEGDEGGRQIISSIPDREKCRVDTVFPGILVDIDTPQDLQNYANGI